jgi:alpha-galactosidase
MATTLQQPIMARLTGDFWDRWSSLVDHFSFAAELARFSTPLFSPDLDMLPMGWIAHVGTGPRFSLLTQQEQRSMVALWTMARAPLVWGGSPILSNQSTLALLSHDAVLAVQSTSCRNHQVVRPTQPNTTVAWVAQSSQRAAGRFVGLWNLGSTSATVIVDWASLGLDRAAPAADVHELWEGRPVTIGAKSLSARLAPHDSMLLSVN